MITKTISSKTAITVLIAILLSIHTAAGQGLRFTGLEQEIGKRTSFNVFNGHSKTFSEELSMDFQVYMYPEKDARFGYFFRIIEDGGNKRLWNLSYSADGKNGPVMVRFNEEGRESLIKAEFDRSDFPELKWIGIKLNIDLSRQKVILDIEGKTFEGNFACDRRVIKANIIFGANDFLIDVPAFAMRNFRVSDSKWNESFPFNESSGRVAHNSRNHALGRVTNPQWMINNACQWTKICSLSLPSNAGYGYDEENRRFYYFDKDGIYFYELYDNRTEYVAFKGECPVNIGPGDNFLHDGKIVAFEPCGHMNSKRTSIASLDLGTMTWKAITYNGIGKQVFHHTGFYNPVDNSYCIFGGYGNMMYNGNFYRLSHEDVTWERTWEDCTDLCPRYFVASGTEGEKAYFFGGMGNSSGEQVVGRKYFYDMHCLDMRTGKMEQLWTLPTPEDNYVPVSRMVIDKGYAYALCYPEYKSDSELTLHRFRLADGEDISLDQTVYICSDRLFTDAMLYLDKDLERIFAVTRISKDDVASDLDIYQIDWPVMFENQTFEDLRRGRMAKALSALALLVAALIASSVLSLIRRRKRLEKTYMMAIASKDRKRNAIENIVPNTIHIFGQFQVIDSRGNDISSQINGQQRDIFLLITKYSIKEGISSERLSKIIWPDKEEDKVKNSRGVAITKLRAALAGVEGLSICYSNGFYRIELDDISKCDYLEFETLTRQDEPDIDKILTITSRGKFVGFSENEIFDTWKSWVEDKAFNLLHKEAEKRLAAEDWGAVMEIVDVLFSIDPLDEQALHYTVHCLKTLRHNEEARIRYADFAKEYRNANGEDYPIPFIRI